MSLKTKSTVKKSFHKPVSTINDSFYCHNNTPQHVVFNARIYGSMKVLASKMFQRVARWASDRPVEQIESDYVEITSACHMSNTRYGMSICREILLRDDDNIYDYGNDTTIRTLSASDILDGQMKIVLLVAVAVGVFLPLGIIGVVILAALLEALRVWLTDHKAKGM